MNEAKVRVCEQRDLDPRGIMLFRKHEILLPIKKWAEKGFKGKIERSFNPTKSFRKNGIKDEEHFYLVEDPSSHSICPICMETRKPKLDSSLHGMSMEFYCKKCDWHWDLHWYDDGKVLVKDEIIHVILTGCGLGCVHRDVPSNIKVFQIIEAIIHQSYGIRGNEKGRIIVPEAIRVFDGKKELRKDLSLAERGIHYLVLLEARGVSTAYK